MKIENLVDFDSSFELVHKNPEVVETLGISHLDAPLKDTFIFIASKKFLKNLGRKKPDFDSSKIGVIVQKDFFEESEEFQKEIKKYAWVAHVDKVSSAMCFFSKPFYDQKFDALNLYVDGRQMNKVSIDPDAQIAQNVFIGENVEIAADVIIMPGTMIMPNCKIGKGTIIFPNVTLYPFTSIGSGCRIHSGTVIGTDGFGYNFIEGQHTKIWHLYGVEIGNDVEVGANTMIDCGAFQPTRIGNGTKLDNDVQIAHNAQVGNHVILCGKAGVSGSVEVGDYVVFGAGAGAAPGVQIGMGAQIASRATISENSIVAPKEVLAGTPARPLKEWMRGQAKLRRLAKEK